MALRIQMQTHLLSRSLVDLPLGFCDKIDIIPRRRLNDLTRCDGQDSKKFEPFGSAAPL
jgi:hypothetical protein